jgi:hypothetical protein
VEAALTRWVIGRQARCRQQRPAGTTAAETRSVLAVDGKTLRVRHEVACGEWITAEEVP